MHQREHFHVSVYNIIVDYIHMYCNYINNTEYYLRTHNLSFYPTQIKQSYVAHGIELPLLKKLLSQCMEQFTVVFVNNCVQMQGYFPAVAICVESDMMDVILHLSNQSQKII